MSIWSVSSMRSVVQVLVCSITCSLSGCLLEHVDPKATPATKIDPKVADSEYWFNQPATEHIRFSDFDALWKACRAAAIDCSFSIDRNDYRDGLLTTKPLVSKQFFELWKHDVVDSRSQLESDTATRRRMARFEIHKQKDGSYVCDPKVVVQHYAMPERRITSVMQYMDVYSTHRPMSNEMTDEGQPLRVDYWYAERRDPALEHALANDIRSRLRAFARANKRTS